MSFLSTAFLFALPLIAVPIAIHLYRGRQRDVIPWGAMQFLASAITKGRSMERFEEFLLMTLRLLAVAALIFALARPMIRSSWLGLGADREVVLILDNSLSMSRVVDGKSPSDQLKEQALKLIDSLSASDSVQVLLSVGSEWATNESMTAGGSGARQLREIIDAVGPTLGAADHLATLQAAVHLASPSKLMGRRIVVLTDSQASNWKVDAAGWQQLADSVNAAKFPMSLEVIECGQATPQIDNLAVTQVSAAQSLVRPGEPIELTAEVANVGDVAGNETSVEWSVAGKVVGDSTIGALSKGETTTAKFAVRLEDAGVFQVTCRLKAKDQLPLDQEAGLVVEAADRIPILFVQAAEDAGPAVPAPELFAASLGYRKGEAREWHSVFQPEVIVSTALADHSLGRFRAIVLNGNVELNRATLERLDEYVRGGGGLWLALGEGIDRDSFNRNWYADGDGLSPLPVESLQIIEGEPDNPARTIHPPAREHIATRQLANTTQLDIDEARLRELWLFGQLPASAKPVSVLLESGGGKPLVVENYVGQGRVLVQAFPLGLEWTNLPVLKSYVVLIQDWLNYITAPTTARYNLTPGASIVAALPEGATGATVELTTPRGKTIALSASDSEAGSVFRYSQTAVPGVYTVRFKSDKESPRDVPYYVARDMRESDLTLLNEEGRKKLLTTAGLQFGGQTAAGQATTTNLAPRQEPVWGALLVALVALLAGELLLAARLARHRHGFAVSVS